MIKLLSFICALFFSVSTFASPGESLKSLPVQDAGRIKPLQTFGKEVLEIVYGKSKYEGREAYEIVLTWMLSPQSWLDKPIFEVRNHAILTALGLPTDQRYFKGQEIFTKDGFQQLRQKLAEKRETKEKLDPYFQAVQRLENQFLIFNDIASGNMLRVVPPPAAADSKTHRNDAWLSVADLTGENQTAFLDLTKAFITHIGAIGGLKPESEIASAGQALDQAVKSFEMTAAKNNPAAYPDLTRLKAEVHYNDFHPFRVTYLLYAIASLLLLFIWTTGKVSLMKWAWVFMVLGFVVQTYGFGLRVYLMDRAPVTNMYETVVWVSWGVVLFAAILEIVYKFRFTLMAGALVGMFSMIVADYAPAVLDPSLQPLEPVLRSNYWLVVHVMTITISYAAFFLAFGLGDLGLYYFVRGEEKHKEKIKAIVTAIYRSMQIGVVFLAPGIILGGIWADYSWGRFWGWDPKETWALIALLGYLAVLHARIAGLLKNFGMVATGILTFSLVIMAWYGVNFVLGAGLHSYGFGAGGVEYVSAFVAIHILAVIYVGILRRGQNKKS